MFDSSNPISTAMPSSPSSPASPSASTEATTKFFDALETLVEEHLVTALKPGGAAHTEIVSLIEETVTTPTTGATTEHQPSVPPTDADRDTGWAKLLATATALGFRFPTTWHGLSTELLPVPTV